MRTRRGSVISRRLSPRKVRQAGWRREVILFVLVGADIRYTLSAGAGALVIFLALAVRSCGVLGIACWAASLPKNGCLRHFLSAQKPRCGPIRAHPRPWAGLQGIWCCRWPCWGSDYRSPGRPQAWTPPTKASPAPNRIKTCRRFLRRYSQQHQHHAIQDHCRVTKYDHRSAPRTFWPPFRLPSPSGCVKIDIQFFPEFFQLPPKWGARIKF